MKLTDYLNAINYTKDSLMNTEDESVEKEYVPFVVNRCLSYFPDTVLHSNEINKLNHLEKKLQFDYFRLSLRKRKRFSKWFKKEDPEELNMIKSHFKYSNKRAKEALSILSSEDIKNIKRNTYEGGVK